MKWPIAIDWKLKIMSFKQQLIEKFLNSSRNINGLVKACQEFNEYIQACIKDETFFDREVFNNLKSAIDNHIEDLKDNKDPIVQKAIAIAGNIVDDDNYDDPDEFENMINNNKPETIPTPKKLVDQLAHLNINVDSSKLAKLASEVYNTSNQFDDWINDVADGNVTFSDGEFHAYLNDLRLIINDLKKLHTPEAQIVMDFAQEVVDRFDFNVEQFDQVLNSGNMPSAKVDARIKKYF